MLLKELIQLYGVSLEELMLALMDGKSEEKKEMTKRKINYFAVLDGIILNSFIFSGVAVTGILILVSLWLITLTFIFSLLTLLILNIGSIQDFSLTQTILSIVF